MLTVIALAKRAIMRENECHLQKGRSSLWTGEEEKQKKFKAKKAARPFLNLRLHG
jgi:hypothetical protein